MTKEEAHKIADDINSERADVWCPLSQCYCKVECESYVRAVARDAGSDDWKITGGNCGCYILKGI